jgi:transcription elongation factor Elf1
MSAQIAPSPILIPSSPRCQRCAGATVVQRITASRPGHEHWTLRCKSCGHVDQMQIVSASPQSEPLDWFERKSGHRHDS